MQAEIVPPRSRRSTLRAVAAAPVVVLLRPAYAAVPSVGADAALLDLCRQFDADSLELRRHDQLVAAAAPTMNEAEFDHLMDRWHDTLDEIITVPATTMVGIRAKGDALGHALMQCAFIDTDIGADEQGENYERLAMSLVRDLAGEVNHG